MSFLQRSNKFSGSSVKMTKSIPRKDFPVLYGMADSTACKTTRETIKTADENMYEDKKMYKEKYGSYR